MPNLELVKALHSAILNGIELPQPLKDYALEDFLYPLAYQDPDDPSVTIPHNAFSVAVASGNMIIHNILSLFEKAPGNRTVKHGDKMLSAREWLLKQFLETPLFQLAVNTPPERDSAANARQGTILNILLITARRLKLDVETLLNRGLKEFYPYTPLYYAAFNLNTNLVSILLSNGSDYHAKSGDSEHSLAYLAPIKALQEIGAPSAEDYKNTGKCLKHFAKAMQPDNLHHDKVSFQIMKDGIIAFIKDMHQAAQGKSADVEALKALHDSLYPILAIHRDRRQILATTFWSTIGLKPFETNTAKKARALLADFERGLNKDEQHILLPKKGLR